MQDDFEQDDDRDVGDRQSQAIAALRASIEAHSILIYRPEDLQRAIKELEGDQGDGEWDDGGFVGPDVEKPRASLDPASLSSEDVNRLKQLRRIASGRLGPRRRLILGSAPMIARVEAIKADAPHFATFVDLVSRAVHLSIVTRTPLRLPPILLVGEPGIGKTFVLKRVAEAVGSSFELFAMNIIDSFRLRGLNTAWKGARMGKIAEALLKSATASPIIVCDEFEKMPQLNSVDRPYDPLHTLFEEENAEGFVDDFLEFPLRADHIIWIASANSIVGLPDSIVDRLLILEIPAPTREQLGRIVEGIYAAIRGRYGEEFHEFLAEDVRNVLARHNPRRLKRIIGLAFGFAAADRRDALGIVDVERAVALAGELLGGGFRYPVGFTSRVEFEHFEMFDCGMSQSVRSVVLRRSGHRVDRFVLIRRHVHRLPPAVKCPDSKPINDDARKNTATIASASQKWRSGERQIATETSEKIRGFKKTANTSFGFQSPSAISQPRVSPAMSLAFAEDARLQHT